MKPLKTTLQILFALSLILLTAADCNGPVPPEEEELWKKITVPEGIGYYALDFLSPTEGWSCGYGSVGYWNGELWVIAESFVYDDYYYIFSEVFAVSSDNIWLAGTKHWSEYDYKGAFVHYNGTEWDIIDFPDLETALTVWMFDDETGWGGGHMVFITTTPVTGQKYRISVSTLSSLIRRPTVGLAG